MMLIFALLMQVQVRVNVPTVRFEVAPPMVPSSRGSWWSRTIARRSSLSTADTGCARLTAAGIARATITVAGSLSNAGGARDDRAVAAGPLQAPQHGTKKFRVANADGSVTEYKVKQNTA